MNHFYSEAQCEACSSGLTVGGKSALLAGKGFISTASSAVDDSNQSNFPFVSEPQVSL